MYIGMLNQELSINQRKALALFGQEEHLSVGSVADGLQIPRPTAKQILQRLTELGLVSRHGLGRASFYMLKNEDEIYDSSGSQLITVYKGQDSFKEMFTIIKNNLKKNDFYWSFAFKNEYHDPALVSFLVGFHYELSQKKVDDRSIVNNKVKKIVSDTYRSVPNLKICSTDQDVPVGMIILKDRVINLVWGDRPIAIVIKSPVICQQYMDFFTSVWNKSDKNMKMVVPGSTPVKKIHSPIYGVEKLFIKDETKNPTHTFKDRLAYEMIRPLFEQLKAGIEPKPTTFASISYGNTAKAMGLYVTKLNELAGKEVARAIAFVPPYLEKKVFGPDTEGKTVPVSAIIKDLRKSCTIIPIDLSKKIYRSKDLEELAREHNSVIGDFVDITEGLDRPAYVNIIIEAIEQQLKFAPDYVVVPFGAGILCNEVIDYVHDKNLSTKVIPVSSGNPETIAVMLYGPIWVDVEALEKDGKAFTRHEPVDRKGLVRKPYIVYNISDEAIRDAMTKLHAVGYTAEPSGASGVALLKYLKSIDPKFNPKKHTVLVINTGNGLLNYV